LSILKNIIIYTEPGIPVALGLLVQNSINILLESYGIFPCEMEAVLRGEWRWIGSAPNDPFKSSNWCIERNRHAPSGCMLGRGIIDTFNDRRWRFNINEYVFVVLKSPLMYTDQGPRINGVAGPPFAGVVSFADFMGTASRNRARYSVIETVVYHEFGHILGLMDDSMTRNVEPDFAGMNHCTADSCSMRQGYRLRDWVAYTQQRADKPSPYCYRCTKWLTDQLHHAR
jgi:hypothetical protein